MLFFSRFHFFITSWITLALLTSLNVFFLFLLSNIIYWWWRLFTHSTISSALLIHMRAIHLVLNTLEVYLLGLLLYLDLCTIIMKAFYMQSGGLLCMHQFVLVLYHDWVLLLVVMRSIITWGSPVIKLRSITTIWLHILRGLSIWHHFKLLFVHNLLFFKDVHFTIVLLNFSLKLFYLSFFRLNQIRKHWDNLHSFLNFYWATLLHQFFTCFLSNTDGFKKTRLWENVVYKTINCFLVCLILFLKFTEVFFQDLNNHFILLFTMWVHHRLVFWTKIWSFLEFSKYLYFLS